MRPYLAIIKDSFREAIASRVLWVLLGLIALLLLAIAPLGYKLNLAGKFTWADIKDGPQFVAKLRTGFEADKPSPARRIWSQIDEKTRPKLEKLEKVAELEDGEGREYFQGMDSLRDSLNKLIEDRDFYTEADWQGVPLPQEAKDYLARPRDELSAGELARLNRLLIEAPFRAYVNSRSPHAISITYFTFASEPYPFSKEQADNFIKEWVLTSAMSWIVGVFGMIAAILVTSGIIPQMFDPGSITLLLSKPISRSLLFTSKFLGGCAFILLSVSLLIGGLWLIAGLRFGIWNQGMLWCIPIFLFMFLIYYAVSALAGLIWKSAVISVIVTVVFWLACFVVDLGKLGMDIYIEPRRFGRIVEVGDDLIVVNDASEMKLWDEAAREWRPIQTPGQNRGIPSIDGPFYHASTRQLLVGQGYRDPFGFMGQRITLRTAKAADGWSLRDGPAVPAGTSSLLVASDGGVLAVTSDNIHRLQGNTAGQRIKLRLPWTDVPLTRGGEFRSALSGDAVSFADPVAAAADPLEGRLLVCAAGVVQLLARQPDGNYKSVASRQLEGKAEEGAAVGIAGDFALVARESGKVWLLSPTELSVKKELTLESGTQPRFVAASPDGATLAILFQNRRLWLIDARTGDARRAPVGSQGHITGFAFTSDRLFIADFANRVVAYDAKSFARQKVYRPAMTRAEIGYYYVLQPLHMLFPKPRYLDNTVQYVLTGKKTTDAGLFGGDLTQRRDDLKPWQPVTSGLIFVGVMLLFACIYIERHEF
jgi:ABC-type transport system involved in multi-copper enzyme maturation permease subunit